MLLMVLGGSLGLMMGALESFLRVIFVLLRAFGGTLNSQNFFWGSLPGQIHGFLFVSSFAPFFEIIVFLISEPLGVDFELSS